MKLKVLGVLLVVCLMATSAFAATIGNWGTADYTVGSWNDPTKWQAGTVPVPTTSASDEIKATRIGSDMTVDGISGASYDYIQRLSLCSTNSAAPVIMRIKQTGATTAFGMGEMRIGSPTSGTVNAYAEVYQTGGTLTVNDFYVARNKQQASGTGGNALYKISGGTLQVRSSAPSTAGRIFIASYAETSGVAGVGRFVIDGDSSTINMNHLLVGSATVSTGNGDATLEYQLTSAGKVSKITVVDTKLDQVAASLTKLVVNATTAPIDDILLVENTGSTAVLGLFDTINGIAASEGAIVNLAGADYALTYLYDSVTKTVGAGNDIALWIPEPATIALFSLGLIAIRRKR